MAKVNTNISPYYDDYDETKNFHRILFKPGVALQARELTQVQTILQDQIRRFGNHIFTDGTRITKTEAPQVAIDTQVRSIRLQTTYLSNPINVHSFVNTYVTGANSNIIGYVSLAYSENDPTEGDPPTIVINLKPGYENNGIFTPNETVSFYTTYGNAAVKSAAITSAITAANTTITALGSTDVNSVNLILDTPTTTIKAGDRVIYTGLSSDLYVAKVETNGSTLVLNKRPGATVNRQSITFARENTQKSSIVSVTSGVFYKNGYFVRTGTQIATPEKYNQHANKSVGLIYNESVVTADDDVSLLDPALESSNYFAYGADRLKITLDIASKDLNSNGLPDIDEDYIEIARINNGVIEYTENETDYGKLGSYLAKRTYDESGNYTVSPFKITNSPTAPTDTNIQAFISPGQAYVGGYDITTVAPTEINISKARTTSTIQDINILNKYGSYILVQSIGGGLFDPRNLLPYWKLEAHSAFVPTSNSTILGYAQPQHIEYHSGSGANTIYRLYTYYLEPTTSNFYKANSFVCVASSQTNPAGGPGPTNTGSYASPLFRANVSASGKVSGNIVLYNAPDTSVTTDRFIFPAPKTYVKSITNNRLTYANVLKKIEITSGGSITRTLAAPEQFAGASGTTLTTAEKQQYYAMVVNQVNVSACSYTAGQYIPLDTGATMSISPDGRSLTFDLTDATFTGNVDLYVTVETENLPVRTKTLVENANTTIELSSSYVWKDLGKSDIADFKGIYRLGSNSWLGDYNSGTTYTADKFVSNSGLIYRSITSSTGESLSNVTYWELVPQQYFLDFDFWNGQTDQFYDHGHVRFTGNVANAPGNCVVIFNYFTHSGTGVITPASYPDYNKIPTFVSPVDKRRFSLRDCLDFRPRRIDGLPANVNAFSAAEIPTPYTYTEADVEYYLGRKDRIYVQNRDVSDDRKGKVFWVDTGLPADNPLTPADSSDSTQMSIATLSVMPYTYSSGDVNITYASPNRYTMGDIGNIDKRLTKLETTVKRHDLELAGVGKIIYDANLNSLFKTSVFTDDFSDLSRGLTTSKYFNCTIDTSRRECYPRYDRQILNMGLLDTTQVSVNSDIITNKYTEEEFINHTNASLSDIGHTTVDGETLGVSVNPSESSTNTGRVSLSPSFVKEEVFYYYQDTSGGGDGDGGSAAE